MDDTDNIKAGGITNTAISATAAIASSKLNLALITQSIAMSGVILKQAKGADVASATTTTLGDDGNFFFITGTTTITSITAKVAGTVIVLKFNGALTLTNGSNLKLVADFVTVAGDTIILVSDGTNWWEISRLKANGAGFENLGSISSGAGVIPAINIGTRIQIFTSSGTFVAPTGVTKVYLSMVGAGGGGGSDGGTVLAGGGGGGASLLNYVYTVVPGNSYTVTIGAGGIAANPGTGGTGGSTTFDTITCVGGAGGTINAGGVGGNNTATASAANLFSASATTTTAGVTPGNQFIFGGNGGKGNGSGSAGAGGGTPFGPGGTGGANTGTAGTPGAVNTGAGGGGTVGVVSAIGGTGLVIVMY